MSSSADREDFRAVFTEDGVLTSAHAAGATISTTPATVFVVLDKHITTVCSCCLKVSNGEVTLLRCSKCCFVRYCSVECQAKDWKRSHKKECSLLPIVWKMCPNQTTDLARLFVRMVLDPTVYQSGVVLGVSDITQPVRRDIAHDLVRLHLLKVRKEKHDDCLLLFGTWQRLLQTLNSRFGVYLRQFGVFLGAVTKLLILTTPIVPEGKAMNEGSNSPIAYATFRSKAICIPSCKRNVVFITVLDPVKGPTLQIKAVRPLEAGEKMSFANVQNLLADSFVLRVKSIIPVVCCYCADDADTLVSYCMTRVDVVCRRCKQTVVKKHHQCNDDFCGGACFIMYCQFCNISIDHKPIVEFIVSDMQELMQSLLSKEEPCPTSELEDEAEGIEDLIKKLGPMVAPTSFPLGILFRELAGNYEKLGRMDKCVEAYKAIIPVAEKHLDLFDQNIFDGVARLIVYHLERGETAASLPYIEKAWDRMQYIPGKDSFDFYVVDRLRTAVRNDPDFSFAKFCTAAPR